MPDAHPIAHFSHTLRRPDTVRDYPLVVTITALCHERRSLMCSVSGEIRIDYDTGASYNPLQPGTLYWPGGSPPETNWRGNRVPAPPVTADEPVIDRLADLQTAAAAGRRGPPLLDCVAEPTPWEGVGGGDERLQTVIPFLGKASHGKASTGGIEVSWAAVSTHVPGRSGRECRERWEVLNEVQKPKKTRARPSMP